ncbi:hypothetical protein ABID92_000420 [Frigoribacterium sp. PvP120]|uniref:hypothetical protein n=1 Tax=unclassified Frigoribacterium TaxID=2627005 RepID=UPI001AE90811|nr:hypothetical protein [Frigoribacterium sp. PvP121]MBP1241752.1 hypothetical protein [Frigoribacterium sp. PvP121]
MPASVGLSRYAELRGIEQFVNAADAALLLTALLDDVAKLPGCYRATVNEGNRSRPRQLIVFERSKNGGPLAATPFNSTHDEIRIGSAVDLGGPNGEALAGPTLAAIRRLGPAYGVLPTGMDFSRPESWHFNIYPAMAAAMLALLRARDAGTPTPPPEEDDMTDIAFVEVNDPKSVWHGSTGYYTSGEGFVVTSEGGQGRGLYEAKRLTAGVFGLKVEHRTTDEAGWILARAAERPDPAVFDTAAIAGAVAASLKAGGSLASTAITAEVVQQITQGVADTLSARLKS